jgi:cell fate regulator YaaT (PSP1 superfamily)
LETGLRISGGRKDRLQRTFGKTRFRTLYGLEDGIMSKAVGIRFKPAGKIYDFDCGAFVLNPGDHVIVETDQGLGFGTVAVAPEAYDGTKSKRPLKKIFRLAAEKDFAQLENNRRKEKEAYIYCQQCIRQLKLNMNLFAVESTFDGGKITCFFTAEARVDFRELVKMIARKLNIRVEMRQVGIRNQAKMCGGLGRCGRELCCATFIDKFDPVSIRMAKDQGLSLNPTKISGQCGRLMCCLTYEHKTYSDLKKQFPKIGKNIDTSFGKGKVLRHNVLAGRMAVRLEDSTEKEIILDDIVREKDQGSAGAGEEAKVQKEPKAGKPNGKKADRHRSKKPQHHKGATQRKGNSGKGQKRQGRARKNPDASGGGN